MTDIDKLGVDLEETPIVVKAKGKMYLSEIIKQVMIVYHYYMMF